MDAQGRLFFPSCTLRTVELRTHHVVVFGLSCCACGEQAQYDWRFGYDAKRVKGLVDFQIYTDDLAKEMGVLPPLGKLFFQKPQLWMSLMFGPVSTVHDGTVHETRDASGFVRISSRHRKASFRRALFVSGFGLLWEGVVSRVFLLCGTVLSIPWRYYCRVWEA